MIGGSAAKWVIAAGVLLGLGMGPAGAAEMAKKVEISPFAGYVNYDNELRRDSGLIFGSRFGYWFTNTWETELSVEGSNTDQTDMTAAQRTSNKAPAVLGHVDLLYNFDISKTFIPYLAAGVGMANYFQVRDHTGPVRAGLVDYGAGLRVMLTDWLALRADVRQPVSFSKPMWNIMYTGGLSFFFGGAPEAVAEQPAKPVTVEQPAKPAAPPAPKEPEKKAEPAPAPAPKVAPAIQLIPRIHFAFDKYTIDPEAQKTLQNNAEYLKKNPAAKVRIEGNCDERGTVEYNMALGENRAKAAQQYLVDLGIPADRMSTVSYGKERPLDPGHNEEAWAKNRNATFVDATKK